MTALPRFAAIALVLTLTGCAKSNGGLRCEDDVAEFASLKLAAAGRPVRTYRIATVTGGAAPVRVALHETGAVDATRTIVLLHGCLSDAACWRFVSGSLGEDARLVMVDLPGCGASDKPAARDVGPGGYSPDALAARVLQALDAGLAGDARRGPVTLLGHSLGGTIALRMMGSADLRSRHESLLRRVDSVVLLSPADLNMPNPPQVFVQIAAVSAAQVALGDVTGILRGRIYAGTRESYDDPTRAVREEAARLHGILLRADTRAAAQAILRQALPRRGNRPHWQAVARLEEDYANVDVPCLIVWGAHDETLPVASGYKLAALLPRATLVVAPDCMHSVHLEQPSRCAALVRDFARDPAGFRARAAPSGRATAWPTAAAGQPARGAVASPAGAAR